MEWCLLCLESNKGLLDPIEINSSRWEDLAIGKILEKHFWALSITHQTRSWICSSCWQEVDNFHKFYLRIEEAHVNFGQIKIEGNDILEAKIEINEEVEDPSDILIDQNALQPIINIDEDFVSQEGDTNGMNNFSTLHEDPLQKPTASKRKYIKNSETKTLFSTNSAHKEKLPKIKKETTDSDNNDIDNESEDDDYIDDDDDASSFDAVKIPTECRNRKENDKFIAEHFKQMFCDICDIPFVNFNAMKKHFLLTHSTQKGYLVCCNRKYYQRTHLVDHLQCHLNPDYFKCSQCGKILSDRENFRNHMLRVHRPEDIVVKHSCDICGKSFIKANVLRTHKLTHLPKKFSCTQCGKFYGSSYLLKIHTEVIHLKKHAKVCYICGKVLRTSTEYKAHMNKHEGITAPVINCDVCGLKLISERSLKLHKESQHPVGGKIDHPCPLCDKVSPTARALKKHINTMHEKGFDHKCTMCEKAFRRAEALKEHMASHTGTTLYKCPWCPKTFNSNGNMHAHRKKMHPKEWEEAKLQKYSES